MNALRLYDAIKAWEEEFYAANPRKIMSFSFRAEFANGIARKYEELTEKAEIKNALD